MSDTIDTIIKQLLLQFILILLNAFFAATEIAVISLNEKKVRSMADDGDKRAKKMLKIIDDPTRFLSTIQVGITLAGFLGSAFAADNFSEKLTSFIMNLFKMDITDISKFSRINSISVIVITLVLSYFTLVLGELVPKRIAMKHKEKLAGRVCGIISFLTTVLRPIIWFLTVSTNGVLRLFRIDPDEKEETVSEEDIVIMLDAGADEGSLKQDDIEYIKNVFKLERLSAADIMTKRKSLVAVPKDIERDELLSLIENEGYSRIPVYDGEIDNIAGILHTREYLLKCMREDFKIDDVLIPAEFVPETIHLDHLFKDMQEKRSHMVIVINEYGLVLGVVTMEDIIEELVGEIWDEGDKQEIEAELIVKEGENTYKASAEVSTAEFFEYFDLEENHEISSTTLNGWILEESGSIAEAGFSFEYENLKLEVVSTDELMVKEVLVTVIENEDDEDEDEKEKRSEDSEEE